MAKVVLAPNEGFDQSLYVDQSMTWKFANRISFETECLLVFDNSNLKLSDSCFISVNFYN